MGLTADVVKTNPETAIERKVGATPSTTPSANPMTKVALPNGGREKIDHIMVLAQSAEAQMVPGSPDVLRALDRDLVQPFRALQKVWGSPQATNMNAYIASVMTVLGTGPAISVEMTDLIKTSVQSSIVEKELQRIVENKMLRTSETPKHLADYIQTSAGNSREEFQAQSEQRLLSNGGTQILSSIRKIQHYFNSEVAEVFSRASLQAVSNYERVPGFKELSPANRVRAYMAAKYNSPSAANKIIETAGSLEYNQNGEPRDSSQNRVLVATLLNEFPKIDSRDLGSVGRAIASGGLLAELYRNGPREDQVRINWAKGQYFSRTPEEERRNPVDPAARPVPNLLRESSF